MCIGLVPNDPWKYARKKPIIIKFREPFAESKCLDPDLKKWVDVEKIQTKEGTLYAVCGRDYIIAGVHGELYPIDKKIFAETYNVLEMKKQKTERNLCCCCGFSEATEPNGLCKDCAENCAGYLLKDKPCITTESSKHRGIK